MVEKRDENGASKYGFFDANGQEVIPLEYDVAYPFSAGLAMVGKVDEDGNQKYGFVDVAGREVVPLAYDDARVLLGGGLCAVQKDGTWGVLPAPAPEGGWPKGAFLASTPENGKPWRTVWLAVAAIGAAFVAAAARGICLTRKSRRPAPEQAGERGRHPG